MMKKKSIFKRSIIISSIITISAVLVASAFVQKYIVSYSLQQEKTQITSTAISISSTLKEQISIITNQFYVIQAELKKSDLSDKDVETTLQNQIIVPSVFIHDIYYIDMDTNHTSSLLGQSISPEKLSYITDSYRTKASKQLYSLEYNDLNPLTYTTIGTIDNKRLQSRLLCYDIDLYELNDYINTLNYSKTNSVIVADKDNNIILSDINLNHPVYSEIKEDLMTHIRSTNTKIIITATSGKSYYAYSVHINPVGWRLTVITEIGLIAEETKSVILYIIGFIILFLIIQFITTAIEWRNIAISFNEIIIQIQNIRNKNFGTKVTRIHASEFIPIVEAFNEMSEELSDTIDQKIKAERTRQYFEYQALIAQVNPHFLYNNLNSINALLDLKRYEDIRSVNSTIISMMSYSIAKNGDIVKIGEEIDLIKKYVTMQKIRYNNRFSLEININNGILDKPIVHMSLIPLVENAIFHGFPYKNTQNGVITITGSISDDKNSIYIYISDNGVGMSKDRVHEIMQKDETDIDIIQNTANKKNRYVSIGIKNVHDRLRLYYGNNYGLHLESESNVGTTVTVSIPNKDIY